jgi:hypothetical protein
VLLQSGEDCHTTGELLAQGRYQLGRENLAVPLRGDGVLHLVQWQVGEFEPAIRTLSLDAAHQHTNQLAAARTATTEPTKTSTNRCFIYRSSIDSHRNSMEGWAMGKLTVGALRAVLVVVLAGTVFVQALMVWALATDPEDGSLPLTPLRVITILGMVSVQVALVCVWRLVTMVRRGTVFSHAAFRYVDVVIGAIVAAALVWFAVTVLNAPGQRADPGVTVIMGGIGVAILGVALLVLVLRMLLAQAVARDVEAAQMQAELDEVI